MAYNVLIVDDSSVTREIMARSCILSGMEIARIYRAANGREALDVLSTSSADIIFADINMPVMDGLQLVAELSKREDCRHSQIVIVSTEGSKPRIEELRNLGVRGYIRKPFTPEQVSEVMHQLLEAEHGNGS